MSELVRGRSKLDDLNKVMFSLEISLKIRAFLHVIDCIHSEIRKGVSDTVQSLSLWQQEYKEVNFGY